MVASWGEAKKGVARGKGVAMIRVSRKGVEPGREMPFWI